MRTTATVTSLGFSISSRFQSRGFDAAEQATKTFGGRLEKLSERAKVAGEKIAGAMEKAGVGAGLALGAGMVSAVDASSAAAKLQAQLGLTAKESQRFGKIAGSVYSKAYGESLEEVNTAIGAVVSSVDGMRSASNTAVASMTEKALTLGKAFEIEVGRSVQVVGQLVKSGLVSTANEGFDLLTATLQKVPANVREDVLDALDEYSPFMRQIGIQGQQAFELLAQSAAKGMFGLDKTGDALKEFTLKATDMSAGTQAAFKTLGLNVHTVTNDLLVGGDRGAAAFQKIVTGLLKIKDPAKQSTAAVALFGTPLEDLNKGEIPKFLRSLDTTQHSLGNTAGAADRAGAALQNTASARLAGFKRSLEVNVTNVIGGSVLPMLTRLQQAGQRFGIGAPEIIKAVLAIAALAAVIKVVTFATTAWSVAQAILNGVLLANPVGLLAVALIALGALFVVLWQKSETFRNIVLAVWAGIKTAIAAAWAVIKPVFDLYKWYVMTVLVGALKLYWAYVKFVFTAVWTIITTAWGIIRAVFSAIVGFLQGPLRIAWTVLQNTIKIVWIAIQIYIKVAWAIIKTYFNAIKWYISNVLAPIFMFLYRNVIKPAWSGIKAVISAVWTGGIRPVFNALKSAVDDVRRGFSVAVDAIRKIWGGLKSAAKTPVNFVIGVYNKGIVDLVNKVAGFAGIKTRLNKIPLLARGGTLANPLAAQPMMTNGPMAIVGEGRKQYPEFVIPTDPAHRRRAEALWAMAGQHFGMPPDRQWLIGRKSLGGEGIAFARGGSLQALAFGGVIGGFVKGLKDWTLNAPEKALKGVLGKVLGGSVPGSGVFRDVVARIPVWIKDQVLSWFKKKANGMGGGPGIQRALAFARSQVGKPYIWGGVGPGGYDCSGFMSALTNVIQGRSPYSRRFTTFSFTGAKNGPAGFVKGLRSAFSVGVTNAGVGHMAGTLAGVNVESSGSRGVHMGPGARGTGDGLFGMHYGLKADTGALTLAPGWNPPTYNGTGRMEYLETPRRGGGGDVHVHLENHGVIGSRLELQNWLTKTVVDLKKRGRLP